MIAIAYLIDNYEEIQQSEVLSLPNPPKLNWVEREFYFVLNAVVFAFEIDDVGVKKIKIFLAGQIILLKHTEDTWLKIKNHLSAI